MSATTNVGTSATAQRSGLGIQLVSHASLILQTEAGGIWTDPWLRSTAFNDSWTLLDDPVITDGDLGTVAWLWVSHEHPDHFNIPTLRSLPDDLKARVTVLYQQNNSTKMIDAFTKLGFPNHRLMPHREQVDLGSGVTAYCYQVGQMDSVLHVRNADGRSVLNVNDAEINDRDCARIVADVGRPAVVLNQFSIAGYDGLPNPEVRVPEHCTRILDNVARNHRDLGAEVTIPMASFVYFSAPDNAYINPSVNTPRDVFDRLGRDGSAVKVLRPGENWEVGDKIDNAQSLAHWDEVYSGVGDLPLSTPPVVAFEQLEAAFDIRCTRLHAHYPRWLLRRAGPLVVRIDDLDLSARISFADRAFSATREPFDAVVNSQPLLFVLEHPFGLQTLGVSGRYRLTGASKRWKFLRVLMSLENAEIYLKARQLADPKLLKYLASRWRGAFGQLRYQVRRM